MVIYFFYKINIWEQIIIWKKNSSVSIFSDACDSVDGISIFSDASLSDHEAEVVHKKSMLIALL